MEDESLSCFLCEESLLCLDEEDEEEPFVDCSSSFGVGSCIEQEDDELEYLTLLFDREAASGWYQRDSRCDHRGGGNADNMSSREWLKRARLEAFSWILSARALFGFQFQTVYLSMTYFDQFLSRRSPVSEDNWAIRLLAVACLSLAAKMEEVHVPLLPEFSAKDHGFRGEVVQGMELLVLKTLEWRMESITPFMFIHFFVSKLSDCRLGTDLVPKTIRLILGVTEEIDILDHRPSTIAAAALFAASCNDLTKDVLVCKLNCDSCLARLHIDAVLSCYGTMRRLDLDNFLNASPMTPPDPTMTSPVASPGTSSFSLVSSAISSGNMKRKRLAFEETDRTLESPTAKK